MSEEKYKDLPTGLYWKGKKTEVDRVVLPLKTRLTGTHGVKGWIVICR